MFKFHKTLLFLSSLALLSSCVTVNPQPSGLNGKWYLQEAQCFCFFEDDFDFQSHTLEFDSTANTVKIETPDNSFFVKNEGQYPYGIIDDVLTIDKDRGYTFELNGSTLNLHFIDNPMIADDEITLIYKR